MSYYLSISLFTNTKPLEAPAESGYHMAGR